MLYTSTAAAHSLFPTFSRVSNEEGGMYTDTQIQTFSVPVYSEHEHMYRITSEHGLSVADMRLIYK